MKWANADASLGYGFLARRPTLGRSYAVLGYVLLVVQAVLAWQQMLTWSVVLLCVVLAAWFAAWAQQVGALYRQPLVAAFLLGAVNLSLMKVMPV